MLFIILGVILGVVYFIYKDYWLGILELFFDIFFGAVIGFVAWLIVGFIGFALPHNEVVTTQQICALNDSSKIEGQKFLFSGYIEENLVYRYVVDSPKGKHIEECDVSNAYIKDNESDNPYIEHHSLEFKHEWYWLFAMDWKSETSYNVFYVPNGTITNEYNVDLQ